MNAIRRATGEILRTEKSWIHTHFLTNCEYLPPAEERRIRREMSRVLEDNRIVFGIHFTSFPEEKGLRIVLECQPLPETLERIEKALAAIVKDVPAKPSKTEVKIARARR